MAYNQTPKTASADTNIKLQYINGTFCYGHKAVVVSNALGVIRHLNFCDYQPGTNNTNLNSPEETKLTWDGKLLIPAMNNFFDRHPDFNIWALTADSGFDQFPTINTSSKIMEFFLLSLLTPEIPNKTLANQA